jgi:ATP:cob(I)alamin adenosyltransferase
MSITTKTGDKGTTALFGGSRVDKDHIRIECNGIIDEANTRIGLLLTELDDEHNWTKPLLRIQRDLMLIMSHIATPRNCSKPNTKPHPEEGLHKCELWILELNEYLKEEKLAFVLPGGTKISAYCHSVRTAIRTAERKIISLNKVETVKPYIMQYFNRLSDLFYLLAITELKLKKVNPEKFMVFPSQKKSR